MRLVIALVRVSLYDCLVFSRAVCNLERIWRQVSFDFESVDVSNSDCAVLM